MRVNQCCCGCNLRAGTLAIGYTFAVIGFLATVTCYVVMANLKSHNVMSESHMIYQPIIITLAFGGTVALVQLLVSILLIYGVYAGKKDLLAAWIVFTWICFGISLATVFMGVVELAVLDDARLLIQIVVAACSACLKWYLLVVVRSYGESLTEQKDVQMSTLLTNENV